MFSRMSPDSGPDWKANMATKQSTIRAPERTWDQITELAELFGTQSAAIIVAIDRLYQAEIEGENMKPSKGDRVLIDGKHHGTVVQGGISKSLVSTRRSDGQPGEERDWYRNNRLTNRK